MASSASALPAVEAFVTASESRSLTAFPNAIMASPNGTSCSPNISISFSPVKNPTTPPLLGTVEAISAIAFPAVAAFVTTSASKPVTSAAKAFIALPNGINCSPKAFISFSPAKKPTTPPLFGSVAAISAKVLPAMAALETVSPSRPLTSAEKALIAEPNGMSSEAKLAKELPPVSQEVKPSKMFEAVSIRIVSARAFTPSIMAGSILAAPLRKGWTLTMNADKSEPI